MQSTDEAAAARGTDKGRALHKLARNLGAIAVVLVVHALVCGMVVWLLVDRPVHPFGLAVPPELFWSALILVAFGISASLGRAMGSHGNAIRKAALVVLCVLLAGLSVTALSFNVLGFAYESRERHAEQFGRIIAACASAPEGELSNHCQSTKPYPGSYTAEQCMRECRSRRVSGSVR